MPPFWAGALRNCPDAIPVVMPLAPYVATDKILPIRIYIFLLKKSNALNVFIFLKVLVCKSLANNIFLLL